MISIKENYEAVLEKIKETCENSNRSFEEVKVVAVSKTFPSETIAQAYDVGIRTFGENYAQELRDKVRELEKYKDIEWHFIGRIQLNKLKYIVPNVYLIHSVTRLEEIEKINTIARRFEKIQKVLIQVNVSGEETKAGIAPDEIKDILYKSLEYDSVKIVGLMTMAPFVDDPEKVRWVFSKLKEIQKELSKEFPEIKDLSMGMSGDFTVAIEEGATIVRIGSAIFGKRQYKK
ncbi:YggS family pyridoxal phosphate-dependent enzyme [Thermosipho ferrireducens]|uniref:Pyridoxal phosphate homeostasis protein n=1 Tax=Thermosipho ferrireducens TaxID=2571116 RepID=A0ABX7S4U0_9BACT|nr:YggS family pyridoxal phosphate-dependent enzyme [Thermosipho ferrireducens]QTA37467.1 YggS family pyridoxal phosphate-dependent enzyme [Thermosipho ferrireducens]